MSDDVDTMRILQLRVHDEVKLPGLGGHSKVIIPAKREFRGVRLEFDLLDRGVLVYHQETVTLVPFNAVRQVTWEDSDAIAARKERRATLIEQARELQESEEEEAALAREKAREEAEEFERLQQLRSVKADEMLAKSAREEAKAARERAKAMEQSQLDRILAAKAARQKGLEEQARRLKQQNHQDRHAQVRAQAQAERARRAATKRKKQQAFDGESMNEPVQGPPAGPDSGT